MMICKADFEDLFPDQFRPEPAPVTYQSAKSAAAECIARWEDDGGRSLPAPRRARTASARIAQHGSDMPAFARAGAMAATMPVAAAYASAWTMLSAFGRVPTK